MSNIKLFLSKEIRDSITKLLTDCSSILDGHETSDAVRRDLDKDCNELIMKVRNLRRFKYKNGEPQVKVARKSSSNLTSRSLEIDFELRIQIMSLLQKNLDCPIQLFEEFNDDYRCDLVDENEELIGKLKQLHDVWYINYEPLDATGSSSSTSSASHRDEYLRPPQSPPVAAAAMDTILTSIETLKSEFDLKIKKEQEGRAELNKRIVGLQNELAKKRVGEPAEDLNVNCSNCSKKQFIFNLENVREFFDENTARFSESFFCRSLKWSIQAQVKKKGRVSDRSKYLQVQLLCEDALEEAKLISWECSTTFEIRVLSQNSRAEDRVRNFEHVFEHPSESKAFGEDEFISYQRLQSGYLKPDGSIDIRVELKVNGLRRGCPESVQ